MINIDSFEVITAKKMLAGLIRLMDRPEYIYADAEYLQETFWQTFSGIIDICYDLNITKDKFEVFKLANGEGVDMVKIGKFLTETINTEKTYTVLNYFLYQFLALYIDIAKDNEINSIEKIISEEGIKETDLKIILSEYQKLKISKIINLGN